MPRHLNVWVYKDAPEVIVSAWDCHECGYLTTALIVGDKVVSEDDFPLPDNCVDFFHMMGLQLVVFGNYELSHILTLPDHICVE